MIFALLYRIILNESKRLSSNEESIRKELIRKEIVWKGIRVRGERRCSSLEEENCIKMQVARVTWWNNAESPMIVGVLPSRISLKNTIHLAHKFCAYNAQRSTRSPSPTPLNLIQYNMGPSSPCRSWFGKGCAV